VTAELRLLFAHRELLRNFFARDLNARYKGSVLGIVWSLLNPFLMMAVYTVAFSQVMRAQPPHGGSYALWFMTGYLPWTFFAMSVQMGSSSLVAHSGLIQKVFFPREVLPISQALANLVNMGLAFVLLFPYAVYEEGFTLRGMAALVPVTAFLLLFAAGVGTLLSVLTVYFRDLEFLVGIGLTAWFFLTPVIYPATTIPRHLKPIFDLNPMTPFIDSFRDVFYDLHAPPMTRLAACAVLGVVTWAATYALFNRLKGRVAEEL
jgi:lipopolysaccharide transport system permease protein